MYKYLRYGNIIVNASPTTGKGFYVLNAGLYVQTSTSWQFRNVDNSTMTITQDLSTSASPAFQTVNNNITTAAAYQYFDSSNPMTPVNTSLFRIFSTSASPGSNVYVGSGTINPSSTLVVSINIMLKHTGTTNYTWLFTAVYGVSRVGSGTPTITFVDTGLPTFKIASINVPVGVTISSTLVLNPAGGNTYQMLCNNSDLSGTGFDLWVCLMQSTETQ